MASLALLACSGSPDDMRKLQAIPPDLATLTTENEIRVEAMSAVSGELSPEAAAVNQERDSYENRFQQSAEARLSDDELLQLYGFFEATGTPLGSVHHQGRLISLEGDALLHADDLLSSMSEPLPGAEAVEKGRVLAQRVTVRTADAIAPDIYARQVNGDIQFFRPNTEPHFVVVPDRPRFLFDLMLQATNALVDANPRDGLSRRMYSVIRRADYNRLDARARAFNGRIDVVYGSRATACPASGSTTIACNLFPRFLPRCNGFSCPNVMSVGHRMGIVSNRVTRNSARNRGIIMHELMHGLGVAHLQADSFGAGRPNALKLTVPGTATALTTRSLMHNSVNNANFTDTPSAEDRDVLRTLYPSFRYEGRFTTVTAR